MTDEWPADDAVRAPARKRRRRAQAPPSCSGVQRPIHISGDCTGFDSGVLSARALGVGDRVVPGFCSDVEKHVRKYLAKNFKHRFTFTDVLERDHKRLAQSLARLDLRPDVYTAGWPCQPFSAAGLRQGVFDGRGRGLVGLAISETIMAVRPLMLQAHVALRSIRSLNRGGVSCLV